MSVQPSMAAFSSIIRVIQLLILLQLLLQPGISSCYHRGGEAGEETSVEHLHQH